MNEPRKRRWWAALLLNLFLSPAGYVYAGATRLALLICAAVVVAGALLTTWTLVWPPGIYGLASGRSWALIPLNLALGLLMGLHAAALTRRPARSRLNGWRLWLLAAALPFGLVMSANVIRLISPIAFYTAASASMEPNISPGDIVAVHGARAFCGHSRPKPGDVVIYKRGAVDYLHRAIADGGAVMSVRDGRASIASGSPVVSRSRRLDAPARPLSTGLKVEVLPNGRRFTILDLQENSALDNMDPVKVPAGSWFVLGDNRDNVLDSRLIGPIPESTVCGVAFKVLWSRNPARVGRRP